MIKEFKEFIARGNVVDLAVGVIIGAAFGAITKSLVDDIVMPLVGMLIGRVDFSSLFIVLSNGTSAVPPSSSTKRRRPRLRKRRRRKRSLTRAPSRSGLRNEPGNGGGLRRGGRVWRKRRRWPSSNN